MKRVEFFIGTDEARNGSTIDTVNRKWMLQETRALVAYRFGGATLYEGLGAWINSGGYVAAERSVTVVVFVPPARMREVREVAEQLRELWNQQLVIVSSQDVDVEYFEYQESAA